MDIDRTKVCPLLLRCFWRMNRGNPLSEYRQTITKGIFPTQEVQIYTWPDATLKEISELIKDVVPTARDNSTTLNFSLICLNHDGNHSIRQIGKVSTTREGTDDAKTLASLRFEIGDYLDVAVCVNTLQNIQNKPHNNNFNNNINTGNQQQQHQQQQRPYNQQQNSRQNQQTQNTSQSYNHLNNQFAKRF